MPQRQVKLWSRLKIGMKSFKCEKEYQVSICVNKNKERRIRARELECALVKERETEVRWCCRMEGAEEVKKREKKKCGLRADADQSWHPSACCVHLQGVCVSFSCLYACVCVTGRQGRIFKADLSWDCGKTVEAAQALISSTVIHKHTQALS